MKKKTPFLDMTRIKKRMHSMQKRNDWIWIQKKKEFADEVKQEIATFPETQVGNRLKPRKKTKTKVTNLKTERVLFFWSVLQKLWKFWN